MSELSFCVTKTCSSPCIPSVINLDSEYPSHAFLLISISFCFSYLPCFKLLTPLPSFGLHIYPMDLVFAFPPRCVLTSVTHYLNSHHLRSHQCWLHNLWSPVKNEKVRPLVYNWLFSPALLKFISKWLAWRNWEHTINSWDLQGLLESRFPCVLSEPTSILLYEETEHHKCLMAHVGKGRSDPDYRLHSC